jgi:hypothetical protein
MKRLQPELYRAVLNRIDKQTGKRAADEAPKLPPPDDDSELDFYKRLEEFRQSHAKPDRG